MVFFLGLAALVGMGLWVWRLSVRLEASRAESTALRRRLRRLAREQALVVDNEMVGAVRLRERVAVWHNRALAQMLGYPPGGLVGKPTRTVYRSDEAFEELGRRAYPVLASGRIYRTVIQLRRQDGSLIWVDMSGAALDDTGRDTLWLLLDITEMKQHHERVTSLAFHDALTGLPNRRLLLDRLERALALAERQSQLLAVAYLDLDGFKPINDAHGHESGGPPGMGVAQRLQASVRTADTVARLGGDEFVLLLQVDQLDEALHILGRALRAVALPVSLPDGTQVAVAGSAGVALSPQHASRPEVLLALADRAMYQAKREHSGQVCVFDPQRLKVPSQFGELL